MFKSHPSTAQNSTTKNISIYETPPPYDTKHESISRNSPKFSAPHKDDHIEPPELTIQRNDSDLQDSFHSNVNIELQDLGVDEGQLNNYNNDTLAVVDDNSIKKHPHPCCELWLWAGLVDLLPTFLLWICALSFAFYRGPPAFLKNNAIYYKFQPYPLSLTIVAFICASVNTIAIIMCFTVVWVPQIRDALRFGTTKSLIKNQNSSTNQSLRVIQYVIIGVIIFAAICAKLQIAWCIWTIIEFFKHAPSQGLLLEEDPSMMNEEWSPHPRVNISPIVCLILGAFSLFFFLICLFILGRQFRMAFSPEHYRQNKQVKVEVENDDDNERSAIENNYINERVVV
jgi:hypothetical protein